MPEASLVKSSDLRHQMNKTLNNKKITDDEKMKRYQQVFMNYLHYLKKIVPVKSLNNTSVNAALNQSARSAVNHNVANQSSASNYASVELPDDLNEGSIGEFRPMAASTPLPSDEEMEKMISAITRRPDLLTFTDRGEMVYHGQTQPHTNILDLIVGEGNRRDLFESGIDEVLNGNPPLPIEAELEELPSDDATLPSLDERNVRTLHRSVNRQNYFEHKRNLGRKRKHEHTGEETKKRKQSDDERAQRFQELINRMRERRLKAKSRIKSNVKTKKARSIRAKEVMLNIRRGARKRSFGVDIARQGSKAKKPRIDELSSLNNLIERMREKRRQVKQQKQRKSTKGRSLRAELAKAKIVQMKRMKRKRTFGVDLGKQGSKPKKYKTDDADKRFAQLLQKARDQRAESDKRRKRRK